MFTYYFKLALSSLKHHCALTVLMVLTLALGIGAAMTTLTVYHVLSGNPIPEKSTQLFHPQLNPYPNTDTAPELPRQMSRFDAEALLREARGARQALMSAGTLVLQPTAANRRAESLNARYTSADFFPMFATPFVHGQGWTAADDAAHARVAVISQTLNDTLFAGQNSVGQTLQLDGHSFRIVGVLGDFNPRPRFYDMSGNRFGRGEAVFLPYSTSRELQLEPVGSLACWGQASGEEGAYGLNAPCAWLQYWVELNSPEAVADYRQHLQNYSRAQQQAGRFANPPDVRLHDVMQWLDFHQVVPRDVHLQMWMALGFLLVCLTNTVGLMLAKFLRRSGEFGVRRALGAARRAIFSQCLMEAGLIGLVGGSLGLALAFAGLWLVRQQPASYARLAHMDMPMLLTTFALAIAASLLAGVLPAWHACRVQPAIQLKT